MDTKELPSTKLSTWLTVVMRLRTESKGNSFKRGPQDLFFSRVKPAFSAKTFRQASVGSPRTVYEAFSSLGGKTCALLQR